MPKQCKNVECFINQRFWDCCKIPYKSGFEPKEKMKSREMKRGWSGGEGLLPDETLRTTCLSWNRKFDRQLFATDKFSGLLPKRKENEITETEKGDEKGSREAFIIPPEGYSWYDIVRHVIVLLYLFYSSSIPLSSLLFSHFSPSHLYVPHSLSTLLCWHIHISSFYIKWYFSFLIG